MQRLMQLGPYYFFLDCIARFYAGRHISQRSKTVATVLLLLGLIAAAWMGAEWLTLRIGEFPGSLAYTTTKFEYLMRLLCCEWLLVAGALFATNMALASGKIARSGQGSKQRGI